ncbi:MAG: FMN-binding protein [Alphaproteobacteria bacterium]|nr:MAG: FMN-binding protein [Alphaproteobacteria bacterium]
MSKLFSAVGVCLAALFLLIQAGPAAAQSGSRLPELLAQVEPADVVPGADRFGTPEGDPAVAPVYSGDTLAGHAFLNSDFVDSTGYSGKPIHIVVGIDPTGTITGAKLVEHHEPIVLIGIPEARVVEFMAGYVGYNPLTAAAAGQSAPDVDIVSGATVTVLVMGDSIVRSAARAARQIGIGGAEGGASAEAWEMDPGAGEIADWQTLLGEGSVRRMSLSVGDVNDAFARSGNKKAAGRPERGEPTDEFIDLYVALVSQPAIGRSLLGEAEYATLEKMLKPGQHAILVAGEGRYSFKGSGYVRGGIFDRIELVQGTETIRFRDKLHRRIGDIAAEGAPSFPEIGVFLLPEEAEFDPAEPWRLQLLVQRAVGAIDKVFTSFELGYQLPERYRKRVRAQPAAAAPAGPAAPETASGGAPETEAAEITTAGVMPGEGVPLWRRVWESKLVSIGVLAVMLATLTLIFFFQDWLVKRPVLFDRIRLAYLAVTLFWLGWVAQAQLSVVNVLAFANSLRTDFQWSYFLVDPLIFILWFSVAAALLFWGRGPFCGWLCPFGALQELSNRVAKLCKVPQIFVPWWLHERLWPIKYIIFLVLFGVSLGSLAYAEQLAEIEPFKTAIILRFVRDWWFVLFALALVVAGLFIERFFCRYLCPLGAALAIPGRLRMFDWLKRYRECGNPCMRCHNECPVQAIHPEGHINPNECISCLHCQVLYHHDQKCPVMIQRRIKREKRQALSSHGTGPAKSGQPARVQGAVQPADGVPATPMT